MLDAISYFLGVYHFPDSFLRLTKDSSNVKLLAPSNDALIGVGDRCGASGALVRSVHGIVIDGRISIGLNLMAAKVVPAGNSLRIRSG